MNNIATLKKTRLSTGAIETVWALMPTLIAASILTILLLTFSPFAAGTLIIDANATGGNKVNQIGYSMLGALAVGSLLTLVNPKRLQQLPTFGWATIAFFYCLAVLVSPDTAVALRAMMFSFIAVIAAFSVIVLARDERSLQNIIAISFLAILAISYVGILVFPDAARHTAEVYEPANEGLWRGIYQHKNTAGPVMAAFVFAGIYLLRSGRRQLGLLLFVLAAFFLLQSGSKTSAGTVFLVVSIVLVPAAIGARLLAIVLFFLVLVVFGTLTVGTVLSTSIHDFVQSIAPGTTYTGRMTLWEFSLGLIKHQPIFGYGLESLWGKPAVMDMETPFDSAWDIRGIVHGHNSYLDSMLELGIPGACAIVFVVIIQPTVDYLRVRRLRANILAADFFMMIVIFTALNAFMETFFFRRGDPVWMLMVLAIVGLRLTATTPLARNAA